MVGERRVEAEGNMGIGSVCTYQISFSKNSGEYDYLSVTALRQDNAVVAMVVAKKTSSCDFEEQQNIAEGQEIKATYPFSVFIVVRATAPDASFALSYSYVDRDPEVIEELIDFQVAEKLTFSLLLHSSIFTAFIIVLILTCFLAIALATWLFIVHRKNDRMNLALINLLKENKKSPQVTYAQQRF